jgi:general secretion pathway protein D
MLARKYQTAACVVRDAILAEHRMMKRSELPGSNSPATLAPPAHLNRAPLTDEGETLSSPNLQSTSIWSFMNRCSGKWIWSVALSLLTLVVFATVPQARAQSAASLYKQGDAAENKDDVEAAYEFFAKAYQKSPKDMRYKVAYERTRFSAAASHVHHGEKLRSQGDDTGALTEFLRALEIDPSNELAQDDIRATRDKMAAPPNAEAAVASPDLGYSAVGSPVELKPISNEPLTLHMVEDSKVIYQTVGKAAGINVLFDPDYTSKRVQVDLSNVSLFDALRIIGTITGTFWRPVTINTIFVAQNSRAKRTELDQQAVQTFYLANASQQNDLNDIQTALRNVLSNAKLYAVPSQNAIVMRATPDELMLASRLINDLDKARPEVVVDVAVLEVSRDKLRNIGIQLPQTAGVSFQQSNANSTTSTTGTGTSSTGTTTTGSTTGTGLTLNDLAHLNATNFAVTIGQATANLLLTDSSTRTLQNPRIRASDGQEATLKIGEKLPVATGSYQTGAATAIVSSLVNTQFQYLDIGVNIKIKPTVHYDRDVTLKLSIEVSSQNGTAPLGGINEPIITQHTVDQTIRLKEGEANIIGGIVQRQDSRSLNGTPGLAELPLLKYIFGSNTHEVTDDEIVFLLIPHVVRAQQLSPDNLQRIDTGTGTTIELRHINSTVKPPQTIVTPAAAQGQALGDVPSASTAAANAAAAMRQEANAGAPIQLQLTPPQSQQAVGSTFQVSVNLNGGDDVFSVPVQLQYDQTRLTLVNVDAGTLLGKDGQAVALVHRDDGSGGVAVSASRPPGVKGVSGAGSVCVLTFQAKAPGDASIVITKPVVRNSSQQSLPASGSQAVVHVQ